MEPLAWILECLLQPAHLPTCLLHATLVLLPGLLRKVVHWLLLLPCRFFTSGLYCRIVCHLGDDAPCTSLRTAFNAAMTTLFQFPPFVLLPFRCGGLCAALPPPPEGRAERAG